MLDVVVDDGPQITQIAITLLPGQVMAAHGDKITVKGGWWDISGTADVPMAYEGGNWPQCGFSWTCLHDLYHRCILAQGHRNNHTDVSGNAPTQAEYATAKDDGATDC